jgi:hypothetical protein
MDGSLEYQVTLEDYLDGNKAILQHNFAKSWLYLLPSETQLNEFRELLDRHVNKIK